MSFRTYPATEPVNDNDKLYAAGCYFPFVQILRLIAILYILLSDAKNKPFLRYHAVNGAVLWGVYLVLLVVFGCVGFCIAPVVSVGNSTIGSLLSFPFSAGFSLIYLVTIVFDIYLVIQAYGGNYVEIPFVTNFARNQGWLNTPPTPPPGYPPAGPPPPYPPPGSPPPPYPPTPPSPPYGGGTS